MLLSPRLLVHKNNNSCMPCVPMFSDSESAQVSHVTHLKVRGYQNIQLEMIPEKDFYVQTPSCRDLHSI